MTSKTNKIKKAVAGILAAAVVACGVSAQYGEGLIPEMGITAYAASTTVTWNNDDITGTGGKSFTKDGVTITAGQIDFAYKCFLGGGTFTTTLGNFTKIEVTADEIDASGTGWSGNKSKKTWTGNSSSVSFRDNFYGFGSGVKFVFTIESEDPATVTGEVTEKIANNEGKKSDGTPDNGATAFITKLTKSGDGEITVGSVTWDITSNGVNKIFTKSDELPNMTFSGDSTEVTLAFVVDGLYDTGATANVSVN